MKAFSRAMCVVLGLALLVTACSERDDRSSLGPRHPLEESTANTSCVPPELTLECVGYNNTTLQGTPKLCNGVTVRGKICPPGEYTITLVGLDDLGHAIGQTSKTIKTRPDGTFCTGMQDSELWVNGEVQVSAPGVASKSMGFTKTDCCPGGTSAGGKAKPATE